MKTKQLITRHIITNLKNGAKKEFVGGKEVRQKAQSLFEKLYDSGIAVDWYSEPIKEGE